MRYGMMGEMMSNESGGEPRGDRSRPGSAPDRLGSGKALEAPVPRHIAQAARDLAGEAADAPRLRDARPDLATRRGASLDRGRIVADAHAPLHRGVFLFQDTTDDLDDLGEPEERTPPTAIPVFGDGDESFLQAEASGGPDADDDEAWRQVMAAVAALSGERPTEDRESRFDPTDVTSDTLILPSDAPSLREVVDEADYAATLGLRDTPADPVAEVGPEATPAETPAVRRAPPRTMPLLDRVSIALVVVAVLALAASLLGY